MKNKLVNAVAMIFFIGLTCLCSFLSGKNAKLVMLLQEATSELKGCEMAGVDLDDMLRRRERQVDALEATIKVYQETLEKGCQMP